MTTLTNEQIAAFKTTLVDEDASPIFGVAVARAICDVALGVAPLDVNTDGWTDLEKRLFGGYVLAGSAAAKQTVSDWMLEKKVVHAGEINEECQGKEERPMRCEYCRASVVMDGQQVVEELSDGRIRPHYLEECRGNLAELLDTTEVRLKLVHQSLEPFQSAMETVEKYINCGRAECAFFEPASGAPTGPCMCLSADKPLIMVAMAKAFREAAIAAKDVSNSKLGMREDAGSK